MKNERRRELYAKIKNSASQTKNIKTNEQQSTSKETTNKRKRELYIKRIQSMTDEKKQRTKEHSRELYAKRKTYVCEKQNIPLFEKQQSSKNVPISISIRENTHIINQKGKSSF